VALFRRGLCVADDQGAAGGLDDVAGDDGQVVDPQDPFDLGEQAVDEAEVAAGDAADGGDGLGVGEVGEVQGQAEAFPVAGEDEGEFVVAGGSVVVGEADPAVELGVAGEALLDAGMPISSRPRRWCWRSKRSRRCSSAAGESRSASSTTGIST
jgi:hypothetical protein